MSPMRRRGALPVIALAAVLLAAGCGSGSVTVHGTMDVQGASDGYGCDLSETGFSDISPGTQVTVTAPDGTVLGSGALGNPKSENDGFDCVFPFSITGVKGGEQRYGVAVSHRGTVWFSPAKVSKATLVLS